MADMEKSNFRGTVQELTLGLTGAEKLLNEDIHYSIRNWSRSPREDEPTVTAKPTCFAAGAFGSIQDMLLAVKMRIFGTPALQPRLDPTISRIQAYSYRQTNLLFYWGTEKHQSNYLLLCLR
jgi:hypothetical protein